MMYVCYMVITLITEKYITVTRGGAVTPMKMNCMQYIKSISNIILLNIHL